MNASPSTVREGQMEIVEGGVGGVEARSGALGTATACNASKSMSNRAGLATETKARGNGIAWSPATPTTTSTPMATDLCGLAWFVKEVASLPVMTRPMTPRVAHMTSSGAYAQEYSAPKASAPHPRTKTVAVWTRAIRDDRRLFPCNRHVLHKSRRAAPAWQGTTREQIGYL